MSPSPRREPEPRFIVTGVDNNNQPPPIQQQRIPPTHEPINIQLNAPQPQTVRKIHENVDNYRNDGYNGYNGGNNKNKSKYNWDALPPNNQQWNDNRQQDWSRNGRDYSYNGNNYRRAPSPQMPPRKDDRRWERKNGKK